MGTQQTITIADLIREANRPYESRLTPDERGEVVYLMGRRRSFWRRLRSWIRNIIAWSSL